MYLLTRIWQKFMAWAGWSHEVFPVEESIPVQKSPYVEPTKPTKPIKPARSKTQVKPDGKTFAELLDGLESSFDTLTMPEMKWNWLSKREVRAIKRLGIYIPTPWKLEMVDVPIVPKGTKMPFMASALLIAGEEDTEEKVFPRFAFAIKAPKLPPNCEQIDGTVYQFGYCVRLTEKEHDPHSTMRTFWCWAYIVVKASGEIVVPLERRRVVHNINHRRIVGAYKNGGSRKASFVSHEWAKPSAISLKERSEQQEVFEHIMKCVFRQLVLWWNSREERWSVGVRKDEKRVVFSIAPEHTAAYFADRERTVAVNGTAKKIIHYVRPHVRSNGSHVRAHVRGLREFDWKGFHCSVTAPNLNGQVVSMCDMNPIDVDKDDPQYIDSMDTGEVAKLLADVEDFPKRHAA